MKESRNYLRFISYIAMLVLTLTMATSSTFSWYSRHPGDGGEGNLLRYTQTAKVNNTVSDKRTVVTYAGTDNNGVIEYSDTAVSGAVTVAPGEPCYFKSVITDTAGSGDSIVSLYLKRISISTNMSNEVYIGIIGPEKTYKQYRASDYKLNEVCIEDNLYLANDGTIVVYWFIKSEASYSDNATVTLDTQYLVYN